MENTKKSFFIKVKDAIFNFEEYQNFAQENLSTTIKYILKLMLIFSIIISILFTIRTYNEVNNIKEMLKAECPEFKIENNTLTIESENKQYIKEYQDLSFAIIFDSENTEILEEQKNEYGRIIAILKDKIILLTDGATSNITYQQINDQYNISSITKQEVLNYIDSNSMISVYIIFFAITLILMYIIYLIQIAFDILFISVITLFMSRIMGFNFKYKSAFSMSTYSLTLPAILLLIYMGINIFTGFNIKYFDIAYDLISYIYIIAALSIIKTDLIKQQIEVAQIIKEQQKIKQEENEEEKEEKQEEETKKNKKEKNDGESGESLEGNRA